MRLSRKPIILFRFFSTESEKAQKTRLLQDIHDTLDKKPFVKDFKELLEEIEKRRYNLRKIYFIIGAAGIFLSYNLIRDWTKDQVQVITTESLKEEKIQKDVLHFCENIISQLRKSPSVQKDIANLLEIAISDLSQRERVQKDLEDIFYRVFTSSLMKNAGKELSASTVQKLLESPEFKNLVAKYAKEEISQLCHDPEVKQNIGELILNSIKSWF